MLDVGLTEDTYIKSKGYKSQRVDKELEAQSKQMLLVLIIHKLILDSRKTTNALIFPDILDIIKKF